MKVHLLDITIYEDDGWTWRTEEIREPTWADIEVAIRRLDRFHYPFVMLYRSTVAKLDTALEFSDVPDFDVVGGEGEFAMEATTDSFYHRYYDETRGDEEIGIWRSDQGATFEKKYCCPSMDLVLRATRYFCEYGAPDPELVWESRPRGRLGRIGDLES